MSAEQTNAPDTTQKHHPFAVVGRFLLRMALAGINLYGLGFVIFWMARLIFGEQIGPVGFVNSLLPMLFIPALLVLPFILMLRRWTQAVFLTPALLAFVVGYGVFFVPRTANSTASGTPVVSILTYNTHAESEELASIVTVIRESNADIIALQELSQDAANHFAEIFADDYPYHALHPLGNSVVGAGLLSRYPIADDEMWHEPNRLINQRSQLIIDGHPIIVYNVHPPTPSVDILRFNNRQRTAEIEEILRRAAQDDAPIIIAGDFNMTDQTEDYARVSEQYRDSFRAAGQGFGFTFPDFTRIDARLSRIPVFLRLDYVFHNDNFQTIEAQVWHTTGGSDHRPLRVLLALDVSAD